MRSVSRPVTLALALVAALAAQAAAQLHATLVTSGLSAPVGFVQDPSDPTVQIIIEQGGRLRMLKSGVVQSTDFLNISSLLPTGALGERGLLGFAFSPDYADSGRVFVSYTDTAGNSVISRYTRSVAHPLQADASTRFDFVWPGGLAYIAQPYANHNGGNIAFGPDGYLYLGLGDGGSGNDPEHRAQNPMTLLGKMLRLDVSVADTDPRGYAIPPTNPFVGQPGVVLPEIWAIGLRNPWRWSFDTRRAGGTGALVIGDVGQSAWEEVDYEPMGSGGRNYGWGNREGMHANSAYTGAPPYPIALRDPILEYSHSTGTAVIGGVVYRGRTLGASYVGRYFFGDNGSSKIWSIGLTIDPTTGEATATAPVDHSADLGAGASGPSSFGVDAAGEIYIVNYGGAIYRIDAGGAAPPDGCSIADPYLAAGGGLCTAGTWHPPTTKSDFSGDLKPDLVFENTSGQLYSWFMNDRSMAGGNWFTPGQVSDSNIRVVGTSDLTGDDKPDLLLQNQTTGALTIWIMNGLTKIGEQALPLAANTPWRVVATGDLDHDGHPDLIWQNAGTGQVFAWFMTCAGAVANHPTSTGYVTDPAQAPMTLGASWHVVGAGDINGDGKADLVLEDDATGALKAWYMDGLVATAVVDLTPSRVNTSWKIRAVIDANGDQHPDLVWQNVSTGDLYIWYMVGPRLAHGAPVSPGRVNLTWQLAGAK